MGETFAPELSESLLRAASSLRDALPPDDAQRYTVALLYLRWATEHAKHPHEAGQRPSEGPPRMGPVPLLNVPKAARWEIIASALPDQASALPEALHALEGANPVLQGIAEGLGFSRSGYEAGSGAGRVLDEVVASLSRVDMRSMLTFDPAVVGRVYRKFVEQSMPAVRRSSEYMGTPRTVSRLMLELTNPQADARICDPACGVGGLLVECAEHVARNNGLALGRERIPMTLHGQERDPTLWALCRLNLLLHGVSESRIERGDTLRDPQLLDADGLIRYSHVLSHVPFDSRRWGAETATSDRFERFGFGAPAHGSDYAFVQHAVSILDHPGTAALTVSPRVLFRRGTEALIREGLLAKDWVEAVIALPPGLFHDTSIPGVILVLNRNKPRARRGSVLFANLSPASERPRRRSRISEADMLRVIHAFRNYSVEPGITAIATHEQISGNAFDFSVQRYLAVEGAYAAGDHMEVDRRVVDVERERRQAARELDFLMKELRRLGSGEGVDRP